MTGSNISRTRLLKWFLKEEYRSFASLFGPKRLAIFPLVVLAFSAILGASVPLFNTSVSVVGGIFYIVVALFGLQTGKIGFEARDTIENIMGGGSRILFSSRTLPISEKSLVSVFLVKDALFYSIAMLLPIVVGGITGLVLSPFDAAGTFYTLSLLGVLVTYVLTIVTFMFGVSVGFVLTTVEVRKYTGALVLISLLISLILAFTVFDINLSTVVSLGALFWFVVLAVSSIGLSVIGVLQFRVASTSERQKEYRDTYEELLDILGVDSNASNLVLKSLTDIQRSAGGYWKIVFSTASIILTGFFLVAAVEKFFYTAGYTQIAVASLFSLIAYPIYTVLYRYDSLNAYSYYPVSEQEVYKSKVLLYSIITLVVGVAYYVPIAYPSGSLIVFVQGLAVLVGMLFYQLGLLTWLVKDKPMEFLFDGLLFSSYSIAMMAFMIPTVVVGFYGALLSGTVVGSIVLANVAAGIVGLLIASSKVLDYWFE